MYYGNYQIDSTNIIETILVWGLITGTLLSYVPQYVRLYRIKDTMGISESMLIFGLYSSFINVLGTSQENLETLLTCKGMGCYDAYIPIIQLSSPFMCAIIFYSFFIYYTFREKITIIKMSINRENKKGIKIRCYMTVFFGQFLLIYFILINMLCTYHTINYSGSVLNIISTVASLVMWLPQIYTTYNLKNNHSLSLVALSIHAFGCLTTVIYQWVFIKQPVWVITSYIVGFISETSIVIICLYYGYKHKKEREIRERLLTSD